MTKPGEWKGGKLTVASREKLAVLCEDKVWWDGVLDRVASGITIYKIAEEEGLTQGVLTRWVRGDKARLLEFQEAERAYAQQMVSELPAISDGTFPVTMPDGTEVFPTTADNKNRIVVRQWIAAKLDREKFGEKVDVNITQVVDVRVAIEEARRRSVEREVTSEG